MRTSSSQELSTREHFCGVKRLPTADPHSRVWDGELEPRQHMVKAIPVQIKVWAPLSQEFCTLFKYVTQFTASEHRQYLPKAPTLHPSKTALKCNPNRPVPLRPLKMHGNVPSSTAHGNQDTNVRQQQNG